MFALIGGIAIGLMFVVYMAWVYVNASVFPVNKFVNDEIEIKKIPMKQFFHFNDSVN